MLQQDYLTRLISNLIEALLRSLQKGDKVVSPEEASNALDKAIKQATDIDGDLLLSLDGDSMANIMLVSGTDPRLVEYITRSLMRSAMFYEQSGNHETAALRSAQGKALAAAYNVYIEDDCAQDENLKTFIDEETNR